MENELLICCKHEKYEENENNIIWFRNVSSESDERI